MTLFDATVRLIALTLPRHVRARFSEEWRADLADAHHLGVSRLSIVVGAVGTASAIDRDDPRVTGIPARVLAVRRFRWTSAMFGAALVLLAGRWLTVDALTDLAPPAVTAAASGVSAALIAALVLVGTVACIGAIRAGMAANGGRTAARTVVIGIVALVGLLMTAAIPVLGGLMLAVGAVAGLVVAARGGHAPGRGPTPTAALVRLALPLSAAALATIASGLLHSLVWEPAAKIPGVAQADLSAALARAGESNGHAEIVVWAVATCLTALAFLLLCALPRWLHAMTSRRVVVLGLMLLTGSVVSHWFAELGSKLALADTFGVTGGDAALSGPLLAIIGTVALAAAIVIALLPSRLPGAEEEAHPGTGAGRA